MTKNESNKPNHSKSESRGITGTHLIPLDRILDDEKFNARGSLDGEQTVDELASSIKRDGLLQPIMVWEHKGQYKTKAQYVLVYGFRRFAAVKSLAEKNPKQFGEVRAQVWEGTEKDALLLNLTENTAREDLKPWEIAKRAIELSDRFDMTGAEIGGRMGRSKTYADNLMRCLRNLPPAIVDEWKKSNPLATTNNLNRLAGYKTDDDKPDHEKMLAKWNEMTGGGLASGEGSGEEGEEGEEGEGTGKPEKPRKPSDRKVDDCLEAIAAAVKSGKRSKEWGDGAKRAIAFMMGQTPGIIGVYSPNAPKPKKKGVTVDLEN